MSGARLFRVADLEGKAVRAVIEYPAGRHGAAYDLMVVTGGGEWLTLCASCGCGGEVHLSWGYHNGHTPANILHPQEMLEAGLVDQAGYEALETAEAAREEAERKQRIASLQAELDRLNREGLA